MCDDKWDIILGLKQYFQYFLLLSPHIEPATVDANLPHGSTRLQLGPAPAPPAALHRWAGLLILSSDTMHGCDVSIRSQMVGATKRHIVKTYTAHHPNTSGKERY